MPALESIIAHTIKPPRGKYSYQTGRHRNIVGLQVASAELWVPGTDKRRAASEELRLPPDFVRGLAAFFKYYLIEHPDDFRNCHTLSYAIRHNTVPVRYATDALQEAADIIDHPNVRRGIRRLPVAHLGVMGQGPPETLPFHSMFSLGTHTDEFIQIDRGRGPLSIATVGLMRAFYKDVPNFDFYSLPS